VIGVSFDTTNKNATFKANEEFDFPLWSDLEKSLALQYGAADGLITLFADRITVILDAEANWVVFYPKTVVTSVSLYAHAQMVLDDLALLFGDSSP